MAKLRLQYVNQYRDRHGKVRRYFRRPGSRGVLLPGLPGSIEFMAAYQSALATVAPPPPSPKHIVAGSLAQIVNGYYQSAAFANLESKSQYTYRTALKAIVAEHGHRLVKDLPADAAQRIIERIGATRPGMANLTLAAMSKVMAYAIKHRVRRDNPFAGIERYKLGHYHTWTDAEITAFENRWPLGTRERLAFALLLYTGQRAGDVCKMVRSDIVNGRMIRVVQDKARKGEEQKPLLIPIHPALARALDAGPVVGMRHLLTDTRGQPLKKLTHLIEAAAKAASLPTKPDAPKEDRCVAHGLRKAALRAPRRGWRKHEANLRHLRAQDPLNGRAVYGCRQSGRTGRIGHCQAAGHSRLSPTTY
jgi:integrase